ncbi:hypothetical protein FG386_002049 [Cryptosporidium ryanae]|uniref:uncharacterized protein n=1 Tax=Cryptosporidium ryanae TaxID=515981 RepID=UPI00351AA900|nr:hypothetical protein FG386_002049 [Cryptosporidium ryanae]
MEKNKFIAALDFEDESLSRGIFDSITGTQLDIIDDDGRTLLHNAVSKNKLFIVEILVNKGSKVNTSDENGWTPLHSSCSIGNYNISKILIDNGADCGAKTHSGSTPLHYAASKGHDQVVDLLIKKDINIIDVRDSYGRTAIFMSACSGKKEAFDTLLNKGANISYIEDISGDTVLHAAINGNHQEIALKIANEKPEMLLKKNKEGKIPLDYSSREFTDELLEIIKNNFDKESIDKYFE